MFHIIWSHFRPTYKIRFFRLCGRGHHAPVDGEIVPKIAVCGVEMSQVQYPCWKHSKQAFGWPQTFWLHRLNIGCKYWLQIRIVGCKLKIFYVPEPVRKFWVKIFFLYETMFHIIWSHFKPTYKIPFFRLFGRGRHAPVDGGIVPKITVGGVEISQVQYPW